MNMATCKGCGSAIEFGLNPTTGRRVPLNPISETSSKDPQASWAVWDNPAGGWFARPVTHLEPFNDFDEHMAINHLAVCPSPHARSRRPRTSAKSRT